MIDTLLILLILFLPLGSFLYQIFFASKNCHKIPILAMSACMLISLFLFFNFFGDYQFNSSLKWLSINAFEIDLGIWLNDATIIMIFVVSLISFLVHVYSISYMKGDLRYSRYFAYLGLFTFSMNGVVISDNLFMIFIFWELVGLSSYLLIGFWFEKKSAALASKKAFLFF